MQLDIAALQSASEQFLIAATFGRSWIDALDAFAQATHSHSACIWYTSGHRAAHLGNPAFEEAVTKINHPGDPPYTDEVLWRSRPEEGFVPMLSHVARHRIERLPFYNDVLRGIDFAHYAGFSPHQDDGFFLKVASWRSFAEGEFDADQIAAMNAVIGNIRHAVLFGQQRQTLLAQQAAAPFVERGEAVFAIDAEGRARPLSAETEAAVAHMPVTLTHGRLVASRRQENDRLERVIGDAVRRDGRPGSLVLTTQTGERHQLVVLPLIAEALDVFGATRAIATIIRLGTSPAGSMESRTQRILQTGFDLTTREAEIAALTASGNAPIAVACRLGIGEGTVRNHVKKVFHKIGVHSQVELAALAARYH